MEWLILCSFWFYIQRLKWVKIDFFLFRLDWKMWNKMNCQNKTTNTWVFLMSFFNSNFYWIPPYNKTKRDQKKSLSFMLLLTLDETTMNNKKNGYFSFIFCFWKMAQYLLVVESKTSINYSPCLHCKPFVLIAFTLMSTKVPHTCKYSYWGQNIVTGTTKGVEC
jgi:hypothetical protein